MIKSPPKEISLKDLQKLYEYASKIEKIGKKYGLSGITKIFINAIQRLKNKNNQMEFGFIKKLK